MTLKEDYYKINGQQQKEDGKIVFSVSVNPDSKVFEGHFPGHPVCPGVCGMAIIRGCAEQAVGRSLTIESVKQCRFVTLATPDKASQLTVEMTMTPNEADGSVLVIAQTQDEENLYITFKGTMK